MLKYKSLSNSFLFCKVVFSIYCTQCGVELNPNANFCRRCGARVRKNRLSFVNTVSTGQMLSKAREKVKNFSKPKIDQSRDYMTEKIDSLSENVQNPEKFSSLSSNQRDYLAQRLASLRNKIATKQQAEGSSIFEPTIEEAYEIIELNDELLKQLESETCLICIKPLKSEENHKELVICPQCGHGGHRDHIYSWFETNKSCPYCKANITIDQVLILNY